MKNNLVDSYRAELALDRRPFSVREWVLTGVAVGLFVVALGVAGGWDFAADTQAQVAVIACSPPVGAEVLLVVADVSAVRGYRCVISNNAFSY